MSRRGKVKLAFIANESARKITYRKRKKGLLKKAEELSTLCGIDVCAIVYSPFDSEPGVWPKTQSGVHRVVSKLRTMPEFEQCRKMLDHESFLKQRIMKVDEQVKKQMRDNRETEMTMRMFQLLYQREFTLPDNLNFNDFIHLSRLIDHNLQGITERLETLDLNPQFIPPPPPPAAASQPLVVKNEEMTLQFNPAPVASQPLVAKTTEEMILTDHAYGVDVHMNANPVQRGYFSDLLNGNEDGTMPYGDIDLQNGFWTDTLP